MHIILRSGMPQRRAAPEFYGGYLQCQPMEINKSAPVVARQELLINATAQKIWSLIAEIDRWPAWNPAVKSEKINGAFKAGTTFSWKSGGMSIVSTLQEIEFASRLVWTGKAIGTRAIHVWTLQNTPDGVLVSTAESFEGWLASLLRRTLQKNLMLRWWPC